KTMVCPTSAVAPAGRPRCQVSKGKVIMQQFKQGAAGRLLAFSIVLLSAMNGAAQDKAVTLAEDQSAYTLSNGIVAARIDKKSGDLLSLRFKDMEMLATITGPDGLPDTAMDKPGMNKRGGGGRYT